MKILKRKIFFFLKIKKAKNKNLKKNLIWNRKQIKKVNLPPKKQGNRNDTKKRKEIIRARNT